MAALSFRDWDRVRLFVPAERGVVRKKAGFDISDERAKELADPLAAHKRELDAKLLARGVGEGKAVKRSFAYYQRRGMAEEEEDDDFEGGLPSRIPPAAAVMGGEEDDGAGGAAVGMVAEGGMASARSGFSTSRNGGGTRFVASLDGMQETIMREVNLVRVRQGRGVSKDEESGGVYSGRWFLGLKSGRGVEVDAGGTYAGAFRMGVKWGLGTLRMPSGDLYQGRYSPPQRLFSRGERDFEAVRLAVERYREEQLGRGPPTRDELHGAAGGDAAAAAFLAKVAAEGEERVSGNPVERRKREIEAKAKAAKAAKGSGTVRRGLGGLVRHPGGMPGIWTTEANMGNRNPYRDGQMSDATGHATIRFADGCFYVGQVRDGRVSGRGRYETPQGEVFEGQFEEGQLHGEGSRTTRDGVVERGHWRRGEMCGQGVQMWGGRGGDMYVGSFRDGQRWGRGRLITRGGTSVFDGGFQAGMRDGRGSQSWYRLMVAASQAHAEAKAARARRQGREHTSRFWWGDDDPEAWAATTLSGRWKAGLLRPRAVALYHPWPSVSLHADRPSSDSAARLVRAVYGGRGLRPRPLRSIMGMLRDSVTSAAAMHIATQSTVMVSRMLRPDGAEAAIAETDEQSAGQRRADAAKAEAKAAAAASRGMARAVHPEEGGGASLAIAQAAREGVVMWVTRQVDGTWSGAAADPSAVLAAAEDAAKHSTAAGIQDAGQDADGGESSLAGVSGAAHTQQASPRDQTSAGVGALARWVAGGGGGGTGGNNPGVAEPAMPMAEALAVYAMGAGSGPGAAGGGLTGAGGASLAELTTMRDRVVRGRVEREDRRERRLGLVSVLGRNWMRKAVAERRSAQDKASASKPVPLQRVGKGNRFRLRKAARRASLILSKALPPAVSLSSKQEEVAGSAGSQEAAAAPDSGTQSAAGAGAAAAASGTGAAAIAAFAQGALVSTHTKGSVLGGSAGKVRRVDRRKQLRSLLLAATLGEPDSAAASAAGIAVACAKPDGTIVTVTPADVAALPADVMPRVTAAIARGNITTAEQLLAEHTLPRLKVAAVLPPVQAASTLVKRVLASGGADQPGPPDEGEPRVAAHSLPSAAVVNRVRGRPGAAGAAVWSRFGQHALGAKDVEAVAAAAGRAAAHDRRGDAEFALLEQAARDGTLLQQLGRARSQAEAEAAGKSDPVRDLSATPLDEELEGEDGDSDDGGAGDAMRRGPAEPGSRRAGRAARAGVPGLKRGLTALTVGRVMRGRQDHSWGISTTTGKLLPDPASLVRLFDIGRARAAAMAGNKKTTSTSILADALTTGAGVAIGKGARGVAVAMDGQHAAAAKHFSVGMHGTDIAAAAGRIQAERAAFNANLARIEESLTGVNPLSSSSSASLLGPPSTMATSAGRAGRPIADVAGPIGASSAAALLVGEVAAAASRASMLQSRRGGRGPPANAAAPHGVRDAARLLGKAQPYCLADAPGIAQGPPASAMHQRAVRSLEARLAADAGIRSGTGLAFGATGSAGMGAVGLEEGKDAMEAVGGLDWAEALEPEHDNVDTAMRAAAGSAGMDVAPSLPPLPAAAATQPSLARARYASSATTSRVALTAGRSSTSSRRGAALAESRSKAEQAAELSAEQRQEAEEEELLARYPPMSRRHERTISIGTAARGEPSLYFAGDGHLFGGSNPARRLHASDAPSLLREYEIGVYLAGKRATRDKVEAAQEALRAVRGANTSLHLAHWARVRHGWRSLRDAYHFGQPGDAAPFAANADGMDDGTGSFTEDRGSDAGSVTI